MKGYQAQENINSKGLQENSIFTEWLQEHGGLVDSNAQDEDTTHDASPK